MEFTIQSMLTKQELEEFRGTFDILVKSLVSSETRKDAADAMQWLKYVLEYNVPDGKKLRGLMVPIAYKYLAKTYTIEGIKLAHILGWCIEILQASFLVADDIMDGSITRRGKPCWYLQNNLGSLAINDALLLEHTVYRILAEKFSQASYYTRLMDLFLRVTAETVFGQALDVQTSKKLDLDEYTLDGYRAIVKYKTGYYTIFLPIAAAMTMLEVTNDAVMKNLEKIALQIGEFYQVQDDFLDCFGNEQEIGKCGTDIQNGKCTWLVVTAKSICSQDQVIILKANYGSFDGKKVDNVKKLYVSLGIPSVYTNYKKASFESVRNDIRRIEKKSMRKFLIVLQRMVYGIKYE